MNFLETLYMKNVVNELNFLLVTHTTCFDIRFSRIFEVMIQLFGQVFGPQDG
jgi:hypothetical protein